MRATPEADRPRTLDEFRAWHARQPELWEFIDGVPRLMAPDSKGSRLKPPCAVVGQAGVVPPGRDDAYYQADLAVTCTPELPGTRHIVEPVLIVEILSPSTAQRDRGSRCPTTARSRPRARSCWCRARSGGSSGSSGAGRSGRSAI